MRHVPFQRSLTFNVVFGVVSLGVLVVVLSLIAARRVSVIMARDLTERALYDARAELRSILDPMRAVTGVAEAWIDDRRLRSANDAILMAAMRGVMEAVPRFSAMRVVAPDGKEAALLRTAEGEVYLRLDPATPGAARQVTFVDGVASVAEGVAVTFGDARKRPWYGEAITQIDAPADQRFAISKIYSFAVTGREGFTTSVALRRGDGQVSVLAFDVLASDVIGLASDIRIRQSGSVALFAQHEDMAGMCRLARLETDRTRYVEIPVADDDSVLSEFVRSLAGLPETQLVQAFEHDGDDWWGGLITSSSDRESWIVAVVPEDELLGMTDPFVWVILLTVFVLIVATFRSRRLAVRYAEPLVDLVTQSERMARLDFNESDPIESHIEEIAILARAQERTRATLETFSETDADVRLARSVREFDERRVYATVAGLEVGLIYGEGEQPACEVADGVGVAETPGAQVRTLVPVGEGGRTFLLQLSAPTNALDGALLAREFIAVFRQSARTREDPALVILDLDHYCRERYPDLGIVDAVCVQIDPDGTMALSAAGSPMVMTIDAGGSHVLDVRCAPLGRVSAATPPGRREVALSSGEALVVCSRAMTESLGKDREPLGAERLATFAHEVAGEPLDRVLDAVGARVREFLGRETLERDLSAVLVRGPAGAEGRAVDRSVAGP